MTALAGYVALGIAGFVIALNWIYTVQDRRHRRAGEGRRVSRILVEAEFFLVLAIMFGLPFSAAWLLIPLALNPGTWVLSAFVAGRLRQSDAHAR